MFVKSWSGALLCLAFAQTSLTKPTPMPRRSPRIQNRDDSAICGEIMTTANENVGTSVFYASDMDACLESVPFVAAPALRFLDYYNTTLQFQSTLAFLKSPPAGYQQPAVDVVGVMDRIKANVTAGYYTTQYQFEQEVQGLVFAIHDFHTELRSGIMAPIWFGSGSSYSISAASLDGKEAPKIYFTQDIIDAQKASWATLPSPITAINGEDAVTYLTRFASTNSIGRLEAHAEWNDLMGHPTLDLWGDESVFVGDVLFYPGDELNFTMENGDTKATFWEAYYNYAYLTGPIATGGDMYNAFVLGLFPAAGNDTVMLMDDSVTVARRQEDTTSTEETDEDIAGSWAAGSSGAYPANPDVFPAGLSLDEGGVVTGYFLGDISTGVLSIPNFDVDSDNSDSFTDTVQEFIDGAAQRNLTRVVIDLQQNYGGLEAFAYDTFFRFFPQSEIFGGSRMRSHEFGNIVGNVTTNWWASLNHTDETSDDYELWEENVSEDFVITPRLNAETGKNFANWSEYAGNRSTLGDSFTLVERFNLSDPFFDDEALGFAPYGYAYNQANTTAHWEPTNIVLLTDGLCSSTCALFVEFMTRLGVRTVVMGGSPSPGPMQAVGGSRGARQYWGQYPYLDVDLWWAGTLDEHANQTLPEIAPNAEFRDSGIWTTYAGFTLRDSIRQEEANSSDATPLQFRYEAADCRLYYTLRNLYNMTQQWRDAAAATWDDASLCVQGSTGYSNNGTGATNKPPVANVTSPFSWIYDVTEAATASAASDTSPGDTDPSNNQFDGSSTPKAGLQACGTDGSCKGKFKCVAVAISCSADNTPANNVNSTVNACLPPCSDTQACSAFDSKGSAQALTCVASKTERLSTKTSSIKLTGVNKGSTLPISAADISSNGFVKRCQPKRGTYSLNKGTCVLSS